VGESARGVECGWLPAPDEGESWHSDSPGTFPAGGRGAVKPRRFWGSREAAVPAPARGQQRSESCGGSRAEVIRKGVCATPSFRRISLASRGLATKATMRLRPPQGHCRTSKPQLFRRNSAHGTRVEEGTGGHGGESPGSICWRGAWWACGSGRFGWGTTHRRSLERGPNTP
jgi:hypothetical protein